MVDRFIMHQAKHVVVVSESMCELVRSTRGMEECQVSVVRNWQNIEAFAMQFDPLLARREYGIPDHPFTFLFLGNIGPTTNLQHVIKAFRRSGLTGAQLVLAGDGSSRPACEELVARYRLGNVHFIQDPYAGSVPKIQAMADVLLLPLRSGAGATSVPSKLIAYMLSAKPVLAAVDTESDTAREIKKARCGWVVGPDDEGELAQAMVSCMLAEASERVQRGCNGRQYADEFYSKDRSVEHLASLIIRHAHH